MLLYQNIKNYYISILGKLTQATDKDEIIKNEVLVSAMVLSPMICIGAFANIFIGLSWKMPVMQIMITFLLLNSCAFANIFIANSDLSNRLKINVISIFLMIAMITAFISYYNYIHLLFFFILIIVSLLASLSNDRTMLIYMSITYLITYALMITVFRPVGVSLNTSFNITLLIMLSFIVIIGFVSNYLYRRITAQKLTEFSKIKIKNEEISSLNQKLINREKQLLEKNEQLNDYNNKMQAHRKELEYLAYNDSLTGLPNRKMLREKLQHRISYGQENEKPFALAFLDLDNFKKVNDSLGHSTGDELLKALSRRLGAQINKMDTLCRLGGDEMAILIDSQSDKEEVRLYMQELCQIIVDPFILNNNHMKVTVSIGVSVWPIDGDNVTDLIKAADTAMYKAKDFGKNNIQFYHQAMGKAFLKKLEMENKILDALKNDEFFLEYQPLFESNSNALSGFEALIRWQTKDQQRISPADFIPLAEELGLIVDIGDWVLREACQKIREVNERFNREIKIAVNVSPLQMKRDDFISRFKNIIETEEINPKYLEVEITESIFIEDKIKAVEKLNALKDFGVKVAMDDFGTGYSSLSYLLDMSIDKLKIDKSFIDKINKDHKKTEIVGAIIKMAHLLDIKVVAEGVETLPQLGYLIDKKCDLIQGYYLSRPLGEAQMNELLSYPADGEVS